MEVIHHAAQVGLHVLQQLREAAAIGVTPNLRAISPGLQQSTSVSWTFQGT